MVQVGDLANGRKVSAILQAARQEVTTNIGAATGQDVWGRRPGCSGSTSRSGALVWRGQADRQRRGTGLQRQKVGTRPRLARRSPAAARPAAAAPRGLAHWCGAARLTGSAVAPAGTPSTSTSSAPASSSPASGGSTSRSGALVWRGQADRQRRGTDRHALDLDQLGADLQQPGRQRPPLEAGRTGAGSGVVMSSAHARSSRPGESAPGRDALQQQRRSRLPSCAPCVVTDHGRNVLSSQRSHWREGGGRITRTPRGVGRTYRGGRKRREKVSCLLLFLLFPPVASLFPPLSPFVASLFPPLLQPRDAALCC